MTEPKKIFVLGGARSGKSAFALNIACADTGATKLFVATARALDKEMKDRIEHHKKERDKDWVTIEEPLHLTGVFPVKDKACVVLIDCITLWLSNLIETGMTDAEVLKEVAVLGRAISDSAVTVISVSNEVGHAIVPVNKLARRFTDLSGRANQILAGAAQEVYFIVAGQSLRIK